MIHLNQAASLALIYNYRAFGSTIISIDKVKEFEKKVNENLLKMRSKVGSLTPDYRVEIDDLFFYYASDDNNQYYILKKDKRSIENRKNYILKMPLDIIIASQEEGALMTIGLKKENGQIVKKDEVKLILSK